MTTSRFMDVIMFIARTWLALPLIAVTVAGCTTAPETRRFAVELDEGMYINNEVPIVDAAQTPASPGVYVDTVHASEFDCPQMPCDDDVRAAKEQAYLDFRLPPEDADLTTF